MVLSLRGYTFAFHDKTRFDKQLYIWQIYWYYLQLGQGKPIVRLKDDSIEKCSASSRHIHLSNILFSYKETKYISKMTADYYEMLEVPKAASKEDIKKA